MPTNSIFHSDVPSNLLQPFFHGWFIRIVDQSPTHNHVKIKDESTKAAHMARSLCIIIGSFSAKQDGANVCTAHLEPIKDNEKCNTAPLSISSTMYQEATKLSRWDGDDTAKLYSQQYVYLSAVDDKGKLHSREYAIPASSVDIELQTEQGLPTHNMQSCELQKWKSSEIGYIEIKGQTAKFELGQKGDFFIRGQCQNGYTWQQSLCQPSVSPEIACIDPNLRTVLTCQTEGWLGWLGGAWLPCRYHVRFMGAQAFAEVYCKAFSSLDKKPNTSDGDAVSETNVILYQGLGHVENNWGGQFPMGWFWAQGAQKNEKIVKTEGQNDCHPKILKTCHFVVTTVKLNVSRFFTTWQSLLAFRSPEICWDFNTSELDTLHFKGSFQNGYYEIEAISRRAWLPWKWSNETRRRLCIRLQASPQSLTSLIYAPTSKGFTNLENGSYESPFATAEITASCVGPQQREVILGTWTVPGCLLEFGGCCCDQTSI